MRDSRILIHGLILACWLGYSPLANRWAMADDSISVSDLHIGFEGRFSVGRWTPVWLTLRAASDLTAKIELVVQDNEGVKTRYVEEHPVVLKAQQNLRLLRYVKTGRTHSGMTLHVVTEEGLLVAKNLSIPVAASSSTRSILSIGADAGTSVAVAEHVRKNLRTTSVVRITDSQYLPDRWWGYDGIHTIVLTTSDQRFLEELTDAQRRAIVTWVQMGGRLLLICGRNGELALNSASPFSALAPGRFERVVQQGQFAELETYAGAQQRLDRFSAKAVRRLRVPMTLLAGGRGNVVVGETVQGQIQPLVVRHSVAFGRVVFCAFDLDQAPFDRWDDLPRLTARLLHSVWALPEASGRERRSGRVLHEGYTDLSGQFHGSLEAFSDVHVVPFSWIAGLICVYVLLIGPGDYFLIRRLLRRSAATWITFPFFVALFCYLAWTLSSTMKSNQLLINRVDIVDIDPAQSFVRGSSWSNVYAPVSDSFDLSLEVMAQNAIRPRGQRLLNWSGLPGSGFGAMGTESSSSVVQTPYDLLRKQSSDSGDESTGLVGLPIPIASTRCLEARWWSEAGEIDTGVLTFDAFRLRGQLKNPLDVTLDQCMLLYRNSMYSINGKWAPGATRSLEDVSPRTLERYLTGRRVQLEQAQNLNTPWNLADTDVSRVLDVMMFYQAAGGREYTKLTHDYLDYLDLSAHIQENQALLMGRSFEPATTLRRDDTSLRDSVEQQWTVYRIMIPVRQQERSRARD